MQCDNKGGVDVLLPPFVNIQNKHQKYSKLRCQISSLISMSSRYQDFGFNHMPKTGGGLGMMSVRWQHSGFPCIIYFPYSGGLTHSCNEDWSHGLFGVTGKCRLRSWITAQPHKTLHKRCLLWLHLVCKSLLCWHGCAVSLRLIAIASVSSQKGQSENSCIQVTL